VSILEEIRKEAMAYVGEHFDAGRDHEAIWNEAVHYVLGGPHPDDEDPVVTMEQFTAEQFERVAGGWLELVRRGLHGEGARPKSPDAVAGLALAIQYSKPEPNYDDLDPEQSLNQAIHDSYYPVVTWLINVEHGLWDSTSAFLDLEDDEEEAS
jgi:hypothetical protein